MRQICVCLLMVLLAVGCATPKSPNKTFRADKCAAMDEAILGAIASNQIPGGVLWLEHDGVAYHKAFGSRALVPQPEPMTEDTIFDAASLTKVVATTPAVMILVERGKIQLDAPVKTYLPEFTGNGREGITVKHLLTHVSGLPPGIETRSGWHGTEVAVAKGCQVPLQAPPGTAFRYSDINFILLGEIVQRVSGQPLEKFVEREIFAPLKMNDTGYLPPPAKLPRIAPTEVVNGVPYHGVVHDPTARAMGGVAGHAGLFLTAADLSRYARMLLRGGELDGVRILQPRTVQQMTQAQTPPKISARRGLGWDKATSFSGPRGEHFGGESFGHTGWTGGSVWIDPATQTFVIFLSNRNHPTEAGSVGALRNRLGTLAAESLK